MGTEEEERTGGADAEARLAQLFQAFLEGLDQGRDLSSELLARAGELGPGLAGKIRLELELRQLSRDLGLGTKLPGAPQQLGRFQIHELLGQGGISRVFLAHDPELGRRVALKVLEREALLDKNQRAWILNEARSLARLDHPHVVKVYECGETATHTYIAMELLSGPSLEQVIQEWARRRDGAEPVSTAAAELAARLEPYSARIEFLAQLAEALALCHDHGILHRDIKPRNVIFDAAGSARLIDFGLAHVEGADEDSRLGLTQALVGTPAYLAPEQVTSDQTGADARSDQFAFATLAYECIALENPFARKSRRAILAAVEEADPEPLRRKAPAIPPALATVIGHAHAADPAARYPGMAAFAADLRALNAHLPVSVEEASLLHLARLWLRRHRRGVSAASVSLAAALMLVASSWFLAARAEREDLLASLAEIRPEEFAGPEPFAACFGELRELEQRARVFDRSFLRSRLLGEVWPEVDDRIHVWAARLGASFEEEFRESQTSGRPMQEVLYRRLFGKEEDLCPECTENLAFRRRGTLRLPFEEIGAREWELEMLVPRATSSDLYSVFVPTKLTTYPMPGTYRLQVWEKGAEALSFESAFVVQEGWLPEMVVPLTRPDADLWNEAEPVDRQLWELSNKKESLRVASFRILPRLVTVGEYAEFERRTGYEGHFPRIASTIPDAPAIPDHSSAMAFAAWVGGRLPLAHEVFLAEKLGLFVLEVDPYVGGELLLDVAWMQPTKHQYLSYVKRDANISRTGLVANDVGDQILEGRVGVGFRVVFPTDSPQSYRDFTATPLE